MLVSLQGFAQTIRVFVGQTVPVKMRVGRVNNPMMIRTDHDNVSADIGPTCAQILDMMRFGEGLSVSRLKILAADLAATLVERLEPIGKCLIADKFWSGHQLSRDGPQDCNAVVIIDGRE